ncbi:MAG TPA: hypothetical protein VIQ51_04455 [Chryseosolibacter sp.]|jgi:hypothetical protein
MKAIIQKISPAIMDSRKIRIRLEDGNKLVVHPHIVVRKKEGSEILKTMLDNGDCLDIPIQQIAGISILPDGFAVDSSCLTFDYEEYELVFPRKEDWFNERHSTPKRARRV